MPAASAKRALVGEERAAVAPQVPRRLAERGLEVLAVAERLAGVLSRPTQVVRDELVVVYQGRAYERNEPDAVHLARGARDRRKVARGEDGHVLARRVREERSIHANARRAKRREEVVVRDEEPA